MDSKRRTPQPGRPYLGALRHREIELFLVRPRQRGNSRQGVPEGAKDAQTAFNSIGTD